MVTRGAAADSFVKTIGRIGCKCDICRAVDIVYDMYGTMTIHPWWSTIVDRIIYDTIDRLTRGHI